MLRSLLGLQVLLATAAKQHLFVLDFNAQRGEHPFQLREVDPSSGQVIAATDVTFPDRGHPGYTLVNNNYDFAVDPDPERGAFYLLGRYGTSIPHEARTNYSLPMLLRIDRHTGVVTEVADVPRANYARAYDSPNDHLAFDAPSGRVLLLSRSYENSTDMASNVTFVFGAIDVETGAVSDLSEMPQGQCLHCHPDKGIGVVSEQGAFAPDLGLFCDRSYHLFDGARLRFRDVCWDVNNGSVILNFSDIDASQQMTMRYDSQTGRMVGLGICCDPAVPGSLPSCPQQCIGRANNRTWISWDVKSGLKPELVRLLDPLPAEAFGATWLPLGAATDADARTFTYVAIANASGAKITGLHFVHLDMDTGAVQGSTPYEVSGPSKWGFNGDIFRYGYAAPSKSRDEVAMI